MPPFAPRSPFGRLQRGWDVAMAWARAAVRSRRREEEQLRSELDFHLEQAAADMAPEPDGFGSRVRLIEDVRALSPWHSLERLVQDVRYGTRGLLRTPAFTATVVLSLGLAIGANTAIFGVVDAFVLRPIPVDQPQRLFTLREQGRSDAAPARAFEVSHRRFLALRERLASLVSVAGRGTRLDRYNIAASGPGGGVDPQQAWIEPVSGDYFSTVGVRASQGRLLTPDDDRAPGASPVAVISDGYWRRRFAAAPDVVGRTLTWNGSTFLIVGIGPERFAGLTTAVVTDVWVPLTMVPQAIPEAAELLGDESARWVQLVVRLPPAMTVEQGVAALDVAWAPAGGEPRLELAPLARGFPGPRDRFAQPLTIVLIVMLLVLVMACATVANLVLARSVVRAREFAVRQALGASRRRLLRQILIESALLACAAAGAGLVFGLWIGMSVPRLLDVDLLSRTAQLDVRLDGRLLAFTATLCLVSMLIVGLAPVLRGSRMSLTSALSDARDAGQGAAGGVRIRRSLVVAQIALSLVLLTGGGLFIRTLRNLAAIDTGAETGATLIVWTRPGQTGLVGQERMGLYERAVAAVAALPGVRAVSFSYGTLFPNEPRGSALEPVDGTLSPATTPALWRWAAPGLLDAVGIPLVAGRDLSIHDGPASPRVAVVNGILARQLFGEEAPLGRRFRFANGGDPIQIVGVMRDTAFEAPREAPRPAFYLPSRQASGNPGGVVWLAIRTTDTRPELPAQIRQVLYDLSPNLAVLSIEPADAILDRARGQERLLAVVAGSFAVVATVLTYVGLYGLVAFTTARRTKEIGLRLALGATHGRVVAMVVRESLVLALAGACVGLPAAVAATSLLTTRLYGVTPADPVALLGAAGLMVAVASLAGYLPARRAATVAPTLALRRE